MNTTAKRITGAATAVTIALAATMFAIIIPASNADTSTSTERVLVGKAEPRVTGGITPSKPPVKSEPEKEAPAPQPEQSEPAPTTPEPTTPRL